MTTSAAVRVLAWARRYAPVLRAMRSRESQMATRCSIWRCVRWAMDCQPGRLAAPECEKYRRQWRQRLTPEQEVTFRPAKTIRMYPFNHDGLRSSHTESTRTLAQVGEATNGRCAHSYAASEPWRAAMRSFLSLSPFRREIIKYLRQNVFQDLLRELWI